MGVSRSRECRRCGEPVWGRSKQVNPDLHVLCGIMNHIEQASQMRAKAGPYYERWLAAGGAKGRPRKTS